MSEATHSPLPWRPGPRWPGEVRSATEVVADCDGTGTPDEAAANALFICRAANAHADLFAACEGILARVDHLRWLSGDEAVTRGLADALRAAVAKAKGGAPCAS